MIVIYKLPRAIQPQYWTMICNSPLHSFFFCGYPNLFILQSDPFPIIVWLHHTKPPWLAIFPLTVVTITLNISRPSYTVKALAPVTNRYTWGFHSIHGVTYWLITGISDHNCTSQLNQLSDLGVSINGDPPNDWFMREYPMNMDDSVVPPFQKKKIRPARDQQPLVASEGAKRPPSSS